MPDMDKNQPDLFMSQSHIEIKEMVKKARRNSRLIDQEEREAQKKRRRSNLKES